MEFCRTNGNAFADYLKGAGKALIKCFTQSGMTYKVFSDGSQIIAMPCGHSDKVLSDLGHRYGLPRGGFVLFDIAEDGSLVRARTLGFYPKFANDAVQEPRPMSEDIASARVSIKYSGSLINYFFTKGRDNFVVASKKEIADTELIRAATAYMKALIDAKPDFVERLEEFIGDEGEILIAGEFMQEGNTDHGAVAKTGLFVVTCVSLPQAVTEDSVATRYLSSAEIYDLCTATGLSYTEFMELDGEQTDAVLGLLDEVRDDRMSLKLLNEELDSVGLPKFSAPNHAGHDACLARLEGLVVMVTFKSGRTCTFKYKFLSYTIVTMGLRASMRLLETSGVYDAKKNLVDVFFRWAACPKSSGARRSLAVATLALDFVRADMTNGGSPLKSHVDYMTQAEMSLDSSDTATDTVMPQRTARLVIITGPIGWGKTTMATHLAEMLGVKHIDGDGKFTGTSHQRNPFTVYEVARELNKTGIAVLSTGGGAVQTIRTAALVLFGLMLDIVVIGCSESDWVAHHNPKGRFHRVIEARVNSETSLWCPSPGESLSAFAGRIAKVSMGNHGFQTTMESWASAVFYPEYITGELPEGALDACLPSWTEWTPAPLTAHQFRLLANVEKVVKGSKPHLGHVTIHYGSLSVDGGLYDGVPDSVVGFVVKGPHGEVCVLKGLLDGSPYGFPNLADYAHVTMSVSKGSSAADNHAFVRGGSFETRDGRRVFCSEGRVYTCTEATVSFLGVYAM